MRHLARPGRKASIKACLALCSPGALLRITCADCGLACAQNKQHPCRYRHRTAHACRQRCTPMLLSPKRADPGKAELQRAPDMPPPLPLLAPFDNTEGAAFPTGAAGEPGPPVACEHHCAQAGWVDRFTNNHAEQHGQLTSTRDKAFSSFLMSCCLCELSRLGSYNCAYVRRSSSSQCQSEIHRCLMLSTYLQLT